MADEVNDCEDLVADRKACQRVFDLWLWEDTVFYWGLTREEHTVDEGTFEYWELFLGKPSSLPTSIPAYDLAYVLDRLPLKRGNREKTIAKEGSYWYIGYPDRSGDYSVDIMSSKTSLLEAACELAIQLKEEVR